MYFPRTFGSKTDEIQMNGAILARMRSQVDFLEDQSDKNAKALFVAEKELLKLQKPNVWNVYEDGNMEIEMEVEFEKYMLAVSEHTNEDIDEMSTFRFYALQEYLKEKNRKD